MAKQNLEKQKEADLEIEKQKAIVEEAYKKHLVSKEIYRTDKANWQSAVSDLEDLKRQQNALS